MEQATVVEDAELQADLRRRVVTSIGTLLPKVLKRDVPALPEGGAEASFAPAGEDAEPSPARPEHAGEAAEDAPHDEPAGEDAEPTTAGDEGGEPTNE